MRQRQSPLVIGLDLGTSYCKAVAVDAQGIAVASDRRAIRLLTGESGQASVDPAMIWDAACLAVRTVARRINTKRITALSLSGAMHSLLAVDSRGRALTPAMTWADNRSACIAQQLRTNATAGKLYKATGCPVHSSYNVPRLIWWAENEPKTARRARWFAAVKDWLLMQLTGCMATDMGMASTTGLLDIHRFRWDQQALDLARIKAEQLPELIEPAAIAGRLTSHSATATSLPQGLPVIAGSSDGALANVGVGANASMKPVVTVGTSAALRMFSDKPYFDAQQRTWCYLLTSRRWLIGGAINNAGLALQWLSRMCYSDIAPSKRMQRIDADAATIEPMCDGLIMLPYLAGERSPHWDPSITGSLLGMTLSHTRAHVARAVMESVAMCLAQVKQSLDPVMPTGPMYLTGGVTRSNIWPQIICDVLGCPMHITDADDASATGAAMLGHLAAGHIDSLSDVKPPPAKILRSNRQLSASYQSQLQRFMEAQQKIAAIPSSVTTCRTKRG